MMDACMPPMPGGSVNVTVSIDLGSMLGCMPGPIDACPPKPSTSLTCMPVDPKEPCDPDKVTFFNDPGNGKKPGGFKEARGNVAGKFGGRQEKSRKPASSSFSGDGESKEKTEKDEPETKGPEESEETEEKEKKKPW